MASEVQLFISAIPKTLIWHYPSNNFTCHPFQSSPISLLRVVPLWSVLHLILQKIFFAVSSTGSFQFPMSIATHIHISYPPCGDWNSTWILTASRESLLFSLLQKTIVSTLLSVIIFTGRPLPPPPLPITGARDAHKRHQGYIYSYHRVENSY